jgi:hypothetical protein
MVLFILQLQSNYEQPMLTLDIEAKYMKIKLVLFIPNILVIYITC